VKDVREERGRSKADIEAKVEELRLNIEKKLQDEVDAEKKYD
jgi:hypothetical protein